MKTSTNCVAPEEVMAFVDGELSDFEGQSVSAHLRQCTECSNLAEGFRETSRMLLDWKIPATAARVDDFAVALSETADRGGAIANKRASAAASRSNGNVKFWTMAGGLLAASLFLVAFLSSAFRPARIAPPLPALGKAEGLAKAVMASRRLDSETAPPPKEFLPIRPESEAETYGSAIVARAKAQTIAAPMIARTVALSIVVKNVGVSRSTVDGILARHHGYAAQLNVQNSENSVRTVVASLRIPAHDLDAALTEFKSLGRVQSETQSGEEVTQQHMDLVASLANSRETEDRLQAILRQRTGSVSDVLEVENEIARVRGEIERMEADQKALEHRVDFTTVELQLTEEYRAELTPPADSVSTRMHNALVEGYRDASGTLLGVVLFLEEFVPVILIWVVLLGVPLLLIWRRYWKTH